MRHRRSVTWALTLPPLFAGFVGDPTDKCVISMARSLDASIAIPSPAMRFGPLWRHWPIGRDAMSDRAEGGCETVSSRSVCAQSGGLAPIEIGGANGAAAINHPCRSVARD
jgi:hypothetical protein